MSWVDFLKVKSETISNKLAIVEQKTGRGLTYKELWEEAQDWAAFFRLNGVCQGDRICLMDSNRLEHLTMFFGSAILGAIFVPLNFRLAPKELEKICKKVDPKLVFFGNNICFETGTKNIVLNNFKLESSTTAISKSITLDSPLLMLFTSGSTGEPKGVMLHGEMLEVNQIQTAECWNLKEDDRSIVETPFFHTGGYNVLCLPLLRLGGTVYLAEAFDRENVYKTIKDEQLTVYFGVPTMFTMLSESDEFSAESFKSMRFLISGGASISIPLIKKYQKIGVMFKQGFGLTEVGPNCFLLSEKDAITKAGSVGRPMPHTRVKVLSTDGTDVSTNAVGELLLAGKHVCMGYFKDEQRYQECFHDEFFKTGDLVKFDEDGFYYVVGRSKEMYISGGENVYPGEVEKVINELDGVQDAYVVPVSDIKWGEVGFLYLRSDQKYNLKELREYLNPLLSRYKHPHHIEYVEEFPLLANGKINKQLLKEQAQNLIQESN
jgi:fatty-acyl-CoA synthase